MLEEVYTLQLKDFQEPIEYDSLEKLFAALRCHLTGAPPSLTIRLKTQRLLKETAGNRNPTEPQAKPK